MTDLIPPTVLGESFILDLGDLGQRYYKELNDYFSKIKNYTEEFRWAINMVYETTLEDLIRIMGGDGIKVIEILKSFPSSKSISDLILSIEYFEYDELVPICQQYALAFYFKLRPQIESSYERIYIPKMLGLDYVVITEIIPNPSLYPTNMTV